MEILHDQNDSSLKFGRDKEPKIRNADSFYQNAIENADGVPYQMLFMPETGEGYYLKVGAGIKQLLGVTPEEFTEKHFLGMIEEVIPLIKDIPFDMTELRRKFISGEIQTYKADILVRTEDGNKKWLRDSSVPSYDEETGKVTGAFGIFRDMTATRIHRIKPGSVNNEEDECESLKAAFLHNISHEIRTPLNAIVGFSTLLGEHSDNPDRRQEYLDIITKNADHLLEIIDEIVEMAEIEAKTVRISKSKVNPDTMIQRIYDRHRDEAFQKGLALKFTIDPQAHETEIMTDSYKLMEVLSNLIGNSIKFTNTGKVQFGYSLKENKVEFYISDTGIGIPEEHQESVFSTFQQGDNSSRRRHEGTGLGLAIAKAYVELLGGEIWVTSNPGQGSTFRFTIPFEKED